MAMRYAASMRLATSLHRVGFAD